jgi:hypothetical protein
MESVASRPGLYPMGHTYQRIPVDKADSSHLWDQFFVLWEERNAVVHDGADSSERTKCRKLRLLREIQQLHELRPKLLPGDLIFFISSIPADDDKLDLFVQSHGPTFIQNWINMYRPLFLKSQREAIHSSTSKGSRPITHYFQSVHCDSPIPTHVSPSHRWSPSQGNWCTFLPGSQTQEASSPSFWAPTPLILHSDVISLPSSSTRFTSPSPSSWALVFRLPTTKIFGVFVMNAPPVGSLSSPVE